MRAFSVTLPDENMQRVMSRKYRMPFSLCSTQPLLPFSSAAWLSLVPGPSPTPGHYQILMRDLRFLLIGPQNLSTTHPDMLTVLM